MTKVYIASNNIHIQISDFNDILSFKWKNSFAINMLIVTRDESSLVYRAPAASEDSKFDCSIALFQVTMYGKLVEAPIRL